MSQPYTYEQVMQALRNADAAGDSESARRLAGIANDMLKAKAQPPGQYPGFVQGAATMAGRKLEPKSQQEIDNEMRALGGGAVGVVTGKHLGDFIHNFAEGYLNPTATGVPAPTENIRPGPTQAAANAMPSSPNAVVNYANAMHQGGFRGGENMKDAYQRAQAVSDAVAKSPGMAATSGESPILAPEKVVGQYNAQKAAIEAAEARKNLPLSQRLPKVPQGVKRVGSGVGNVLQKTSPWITRPVFGGNMGYQGVDAYNKAAEGDYAGAAVSGLGSLGSGMTFLPGKAPKAVGAGLTGLSHLINRLREPEEEKAAGGMIRGYAGKGPSQLIPAIGKGVESGLDIAKKLFVPKQTKIVKASEALGPHEGKYLHFTESDRMRSTDGDLGGPGFSKFQLEDPRYAEAEAAWGVASKPKASSIVNINKRFPEGQALWTPLIGSEGQHRSNEHVYDMLQNEFSRQASLGKLTPELRERMNKRLTTLPAYKEANLQGIDVANPELLQQFGNTFDRRAAIADVLGGQGVGGKKGQIFDYPGIMQEMADPMTFGAPTHSAGTRLFSLNNQVDFRPDLHSAFPYILKGQDLGVAFAPVPKELAFKNWIDMARDFTGREPQYMDFSRGVKHQGHGRPHQFIDEEFLRRLEEAGHKQGGLIALEN